MTKTTNSGAASQTGLSGAMTDVVYTANDGYKFPETNDAYTTTNGITVAVSQDQKTITVSGTPTANTEIAIPDAVQSSFAVTGISLDKTTAQTIELDGKVSFTATVAPDNATDMKVKWSVGGTNAGAVKLYSDEACNTEVGSDATETLTVYAKGISAGSATVTVTSNADSTKTASCTVKVITPLVPVSYLDWDGEKLVEKNGDDACKYYTLVTDSTVTWGEADEETWYVVNSDVPIENAINFNGDVHLILCDGATLTAKAGVASVDEDTGSLTIYGQSAGTGTLIATGSNNGIWAGGGITINGGTVTSTGTAYNGISTNGSVTINGGTVTVTGDSNNGIWSNDTVTINGGAIEAEGSNIGIFVNAGDIVINGGEVTASGEYGMYGYNEDDDYEASITINGGTVTANGTEYGIYTTYYLENKYHVIINGGEVTATGDYYGVYAYWGTVAIHGGSLTAIGKDYYGISSEYADVTIDGGTVTAETANGYCAIYADTDVAIGGGTVSATTVGSEYGSVYAYRNVTVSGGTVTASGGKYGIQMYNGSLTISNGAVISSGSESAVAGSVKNAITGIGWTDTSGTEGAASINVSADEGQTLTQYKKVQFPKPKETLI